MKQNKEELKEKNILDISDMEEIRRAVILTEILNSKYK